MDNNAASSAKFTMGRTTVYRARWWGWTASKTGVAAFNIGDRNGRDYVAAVYGGVPSEDTALRQPSGGERFLVPVEAGKAYSIVIGIAQEFVGGGDIHVAWDTIEPAGNDNFAEAFDLGSAESVSDLALFHAATDEVLEPPNADAQGSLWWRWTAPGDGLVRIVSTEPRFVPSPKIQIYQGSDLSDLTPISQRGLFASAEFLASRGETYNIRVSGGERYFHEINLSVDWLGESPENDRVATAIDLGTQVSGKATFENATIDHDDSVLLENDSDPSLWWTWTASAGSVATLKLQRDDHLNVDFVVLEQRHNVWQEVRERSIVESCLRFGTEEGRAYLIGVLDERASIGEFAWEFRTALKAPNNVYEAALDLGAPTTFFIEPRGEATAVTDEPPIQIELGSRWWQWQATSDGVLNFNLMEGDGSSVYLYEGDRQNLNRLTSIWKTGRTPVKAGTNYSIMALDEGFKWKVEWVPHAENDDFENAILLDSKQRHWDIVADLRGSSTQPEQRVGGDSLWYQWMASQQETLIFGRRSGSIRLFVGSSLRDLTTVLAFSTSGNQTYLLEPGQLYHIAYSDDWNSQAIERGFVLTAQLPPKHDDFEDRLLIDHGTTFTESLLFAGATTEDDEPPLRNSVSVWLEWRPKVGGLYQLERQDDGSAKSMGIYEGDSLMNLTPLDFGDRPYKVSVSEGNAYQIAIWDRPAQPQVTLSVTHLLPPANDDFEDRVVIDRNLPVVLSGTNVNATPGGELGIEGWADDDSAVWWTWTAPHTHFAEIAIVDHDARQMPGIRVFTGQQLGTLQSVPKDQSRIIADTRQSNFPFLAESGVTYLFAISTGGTRRGEGEFTFRLQQLSVTIGNDEFGKRIDLGSQVGIPAAATTITSVTGPDEPTGVDYRSGTVWYEWKAPDDGLYSFESRFRKAHKIYRGNQLPELQLIAQGNRSSLWEAKRDQSYSIAIMGTNGLTFGQVFLPGYTPFEITRMDPYFSHESFEDRQLLGDAMSGELQFTIAQNQHAWFEWQATEPGALLIDASASALLIRTWRMVDDALTEIDSALDYLVMASEVGETWFWSIEPKPHQSQVVDLEWEPLETPTNDHFADRRILKGTDTMVAVHYHDATFEPNEPLPRNVDTDDGGTLWWEWTAPRNGVVLFSTSGSSFFTNSHLFVGETLDGLHSVQELNSGRRVQVDAGQRYQISTARRSGSSTGKLVVSLSMEEVERPENDAFDSSIDLGSEESISATGAIEGATREVYEPAHRGDTSDGTVWWSWTCPVSGLYEWDASQSTHSFIGEIYVGDDIEQLERTNSRSLLDDRIVWNAEKGVRYHFALALTRRGTAADLLSFHIRPGLPSGNNAFANRFDLGTVRDTPLVGSNVDATLEAGEPVPLDGAGASVWWEWEAPVDGVAKISQTTESMSNDQSFREPRFEVYTGSDLFDLEPVGNWGVEDVTFSTQANQRYLIAAYGEHFTEGEVRERLVSLPNPTNTRLDQSTDLGAESVVEFSGHTFGLSSDDDEAGLWWLWQAPSSEHYHWVSLSGDSKGIEMVYSLADDGERMEVTLDEESKIITAFIAEAGKRYLLFLKKNGVDELLSYRLEPGSAMPSNTTFQNPSPLVDALDYELILRESRWWQWTAPRTGRTVFKANHAPRLFQVDPLSDLEAGAIELNGSAIHAQAGETFRVRLSGSGPGVLSVHQSPLHDYFAHRLHLPPNPEIEVSVVAGPAGAFAEPGEPSHHDHIPRSSLWYEWQAPLSGELSLSTDVGIIAVYQGEAIGQLTATASGWQAVQMNVLGGERYIIAFERTSLAIEAHHVLRLRLETPPIPGFDSWSAGFDLIDTSPWADDDGDGILNLVEFALGRNPTQPETRPLVETRAVGQSIEFVFQRPILRDLAYHYEATGNLAQWGTLTEYTESIESLNESMEQVTVRLPADHPFQFFRLQIAQ